MKYRLPLILLALLFSMVAWAQKELEFYYLAHNQDEYSLSKMLKNVRRTSLQNTDRRVVVFYLANGSHPFCHIVFPDDEQDYDAFFSELNSASSHVVYPEIDRRTIIDMFSGGEPLHSNGFDAFSKVTFNFYVTSSFFDMGWGDGVIGRLFWEMEMSGIPRNKLDIKIYYPLGEKVNEDKVFGRKNYFGDYEPLINTFD